MSIQAVGWVLDHERMTTGSERLVLIALANHADEDTGEAYPSIERIMAEANIARRQTVKDALASLVAKGLLVRQVNGAPDSRMRPDRRPNLYTLVRPGGTQTVPPLEVTGARKPSPRGHEKRANGGTQNEPLTISEPSAEPSLLQNPSSAEPTGMVLDATFDAFWKVYPRKAGKGAARTAWRRAMKVATYDAIMEGAQRYAAERAGGDPTYTAHPTTWLNGQRWLDEPGVNVPKANGRPKAPPIDTNRDRPSGAIDLWEEAGA